MTKRTAETIVQEVQARGHFWDAYDQGRWSYHRGVPISDNPHLDWHVNASDWRRGWKDEATLVAE